MSRGSITDASISTAYNIGNGIGMALASCFVAAIEWIYQINELIEQSVLNDRNLIAKYVFIIKHDLNNHIFLINEQQNGKTNKQTW